MGGGGAVLALAREVTAQVWGEMASWGITAQVMGFLPWWSSCSQGGDHGLCCGVVGSERGYSLRRGPGLGGGGGCDPFGGHGQGGGL